MQLISMPLVILHGHIGNLNKCCTLFFLFFLITNKLFSKVRECRGWIRLGSNILPKLSFEHDALVLAVSLDLRCICISFFLGFCDYNLCFVGKLQSRNAMPLKLPSQ